MYDSSEGPGRKPLAAKYKADPPQLLPGWEEALDGMQMGQTRIIQVPPALAYGAKGLPIETKSGETEYLVPPNERLQFELTLIQVSLPPPGPQPAPPPRQHKEPRTTLTTRDHGDGPVRAPVRLREVHHSEDESSESMERRRRARAST